MLRLHPEKSSKIENNIANCKLKIEKLKLRTMKSGQWTVGGGQCATAGMFVCLFIVYTAFPRATDGRGFAFMIFSF
jgi:hypothetical protein